MTPSGGSRARPRRGSNSSRNGGGSVGGGGNSTSFASATPSSCSRATPNLRLRRSSGDGVRRMSIGSGSPSGAAGPPNDAGGGGDDDGGGANSSVTSTSTTTATVRCSSSSASSGLKTPRTSSHHGHFTRVRRNSPVKLDPSSPTATGDPGSARGEGGGGGGASGSRSPK